MSINDCLKLYDLKSDYTLFELKKKYFELSHDSDLPIKLKSMMSFNVLLMQVRDAYRILFNEKINIYKKYYDKNDSNNNFNVNLLNYRNGFAREIKELNNLVSSLNCLNSEEEFKIKYEEVKNVLFIKKNELKKLLGFAAFKGMEMELIELEIYLNNVNKMIASLPKSYKEAKKDSEKAVLLGRVKDVNKRVNNIKKDINKLIKNVSLRKVNKRNYSKLKLTILNEINDLINVINELTEEVVLMEDYKSVADLKQYLCILDDVKKDIPETFQDAFYYDVDKKLSGLQSQIINESDKDNLLELYLKRIDALSEKAKLKYIYDNSYLVSSDIERKLIDVISEMKGLEYKRDMLWSELNEEGLDECIKKKYLSLYENTRAKLLSISISDYSSLLGTSAKVYFKANNKIRMPKELEDYLSINEYCKKVLSNDKSRISSYFEELNSLSITAKSDLDRKRLDFVKSDYLCSLNTLFISIKSFFDELIKYKKYNLILNINPKETNEVILTKVNLEASNYALSLLNDLSDDVQKYKEILKEYKLSSINFDDMDVFIFRNSMIYRLKCYEFSNKKAKLEYLNSNQIVGDKFVDELKATIVGLEVEEEMLKDRLFVLDGLVGEKGEDMFFLSEYTMVNSRVSIIEDELEKKRNELEDYSKKK